jgi:hypothetical protein
MSRVFGCFGVSIGQNWELLHHEISATIVRMDQSCNNEMEHPNETPEMMVVFILIQ